MMKDTDPRNLLTQDQVLFTWQQLKDALTTAKEAEMEYRKYVVKRAFPNATEGTNVIELNAGYILKAVVKYNYKLLDNKIVEKTLDDIAKIGNEGAFVADRLVNWHPTFSVGEYRELENNAKDGNETAQAILAKCGEMLIVDEGAPTLTITAPKGKK